jgi:hypothetical protein
LAGGGTVLALIAATTLVIRAALAGGEIHHPEAGGPLFAPPDVSKAAPVDAGNAASMSVISQDSVQDSGTVHRHQDGKEHRHDD